MDRQSGNSYERPEEHLLSLADLRIARASVNTGSEVPNPLNGVIWDELLCQATKIQPLVRRTLDCTVVQIEGIDVDIGAHAKSLKKS